MSARDVVARDLRARTTLLGARAGFAPDTAAPVDFEPAALPAAMTPEVR